MSYEEELEKFKIKFQLCNDYPFCQDEGCIYSKMEPIGEEQNENPVI